MSCEQELKQCQENFNRVDTMLANQRAVVDKLQSEIDKLRSENAELRLRLESAQGEPPALQGD